MDIIGALTIEDDDVTIIEDVESHSSCSPIPNKRMKLDCHDNQIAICSYYSVTEENSQNKESLLQEQQVEELKREKNLLGKKVEDLNEEILKHIEEQRELKKQIKTKSCVIELRGQRIEDINKSLNECREQSAMKLEKQAEIIECYKCEASEKEEMLKEKDTQMKNLTEDIKRLQKELEQTKEQLGTYLEVEDMKRENPSCGNPHGEIKETYKLSKVQEEMSSLRHDIQRKDVRINRLESEIKKIKEAKEKSKEQLLQVLSNQDVLADNYRRQIKQFEQEREKFMKKIKDLTSAVSEQNNVIQDLREENEISTTAVSRQNHVIENLREESEKSKTSLSQKTFTLPMLSDETDTSTSEMLSELEKEKESSTEKGADDIVLSSLQEDASETEVYSDADPEPVRLTSNRTYLTPPKLTAITDGTNSAHSTIVTSQATDSHPSAVTPQAAELHHSTVSSQATDSRNSTVTPQASSNSKVASPVTDSSNPTVVSQAKDPSNSILPSDPINSTVTSKARKSPRSTATSIQLMQDWLENLKGHGTSPMFSAQRQLFLQKEETVAVKVTSKRKNRIKGKRIGRGRGRPRKVPKDSADVCPHPGVQPLRIQIRTDKTKEHVDKLYQVAPSTQCDNDSSGTGSKGVTKTPRSSKESHASGKNISSQQDDLKSSERRQPIRSCTEKKKVSFIECSSDDANDQPIRSNTERSSKVSSGEDNDYNESFDDNPLQIQKALKQKQMKALRNNWLKRQKNADVRCSTKTAQFTEMLKSRKSSANENHSTRHLRPNTRLTKQSTQEELSSAHTEIEMPNRMKVRDSCKTLPPAPTSLAEDTSIVTTSTVSTDVNESAKGIDAPGDDHLVVAGEKIYFPKMSKDNMLPVATVDSSEVSVDNQCDQD